MAVTHIAVNCDSTVDIAVYFAVNTAVDPAVDFAVNTAVYPAVDIAVNIAVGVAVVCACPRIRCCHNSLNQFHYRINITTARNRLQDAPQCFFPKAPDATPLSVSLA